MRSTPISRRLWLDPAQSVTFRGGSPCADHSAAQQENRPMKRLAIAALAAPLIIVPTVAFAESKTFDVATFHGVDVSAGIHAVVTGGTPLSVIADTARARDF